MQKGTPARLPQGQSNNRVISVGHSKHWASFAFIAAASAGIPQRTKREARATFDSCPVFSRSATQRRVTVV
jgi:hypothetical protein